MMNGVIAPIPLLLSIALAVPPAAAEEHPTVIVVEGISLPDHLDAFHARARDAMMKVVEGAGWNVVDGGSSACKEAGCVPDLARATGAALAIVGGGKYRTGGYDLRVQLWDGKEMTAEQGSCEDCTGPEFLSKLEAMTGALVRAQNTKRAAGKDAARALPSPEVSPPKAPGPNAASKAPGRSHIAPLGWTLVASGAVAAAGGGYLLWADGRLENCVDTSAGTRSCSRTHVTHGGWPLVAGGASVAVLGGVLLLHHYLTAPDGLTVSVGPSSLVLSGSF